jgi:hypothetical protein
MSIRSALHRRSPRRCPADRLVDRPWQRAAAGGCATAGVWLFAAWKVPLGLPGHRALGWLTMLIAVRLIAGPGYAAAVGIFSAGLVLVTGESPNAVWGVAQYAIAGVLLDGMLLVRPAIARHAVTLSLLGATVLLAVGWIAPLGRSLTGGIPLAELWPSVVSVMGAGLSRIVVLDLAFGAGAGLLAWALAAALARTRARVDVLVAAPA